ncbi:EscU/YscU/HrcU family type III secretion system export apparatus switch protein [Microbulbifer sp. SAOS-129_SWC]|uniref:EscU/YscU/HrcU family type III secretion system export apparatus switch protein n=1 Tax=Microbulbifer sp. SAOS-129_SWC TaxID=3145235 RepID=UPI003217D58E
MASDQQEQDRSEAATPYKLQEARKRGQVAKSVEVNAWVIMAVCAAVIFATFDDLLSKYLTLNKYFLANAGDIDLTESNAVLLLKHIYEGLLHVFIPVIIAIVFAALLAGIVQVGPLFSWHPMKPDFKKLNPADGFKRIFNKKIIYELIKTAIKIAVISGLIWAAAVGTLDKLFMLRGMSFYHQVDAISQIAAIWVAIILAGLGVIAAIDFAYTRWNYKDNMRMSRREVKEEVKRRDGDPKIKAKIKELQREAAKKGQSLGRIPDADILITNPTHISVGIQYRREEMSAPKVIAKGAGDLAQKMRLKASQAGVPIIENKPLARQLFREAELDCTIPPDTFAVVAKILVEVMRSKQKRELS